MSETRETVNAAMHQAMPGLVADIVSGRVEDSRSCSQKNSQREFFCEQETNVPCCRRRICRSPGETPGLMNHRVSRVI
jgi:hypothetical protein